MKTFLKGMFAAIALILVLGLLLKLVVKEHEANKPLLIPSDTTVTYHGDTARSGVITSSRPEDLLALQSKDSMILSLQSLVKKYKGKIDAAVIIKTTTTIEGKGKTEVYIDSTKTDSLYVYPVYKSTLSDRWYNALITAAEDTTILSLKTYDEYSLTLGVDKGRWYADVYNANPYSTTTNIRTYKVIPPTIKPKRWGLGATLGYGITPTQSWQPFVGVGITYTFIQF